MRGMCGPLFEAIGLSVVLEGLSITLLLMVQLPRKPNIKTCPPWYTSHVSLTNKILEAVRKQALCQLQAIQFPATTTQEFKTDDILFLLGHVFYILVSENQEALNAFLLNGILNFSLETFYQARFCGIFTEVPACSTIGGMEVCVSHPTRYNIAMSRANISAAQPL